MSGDGRWTLLHPRHWPAWMGFGLLRLVALLPYPVLMRLGAGLGRLALPLARRRAAVARRNLELCFPDLASVARKRLLGRHFAALGMAVMEFGLAWWGSDRQLAGLAEVRGLENLESAAVQGKGVLLLAHHVTSLELGGRLLARYFPFVAMYRPARNPIVQYVMARARTRICTRAIPRDQIKQIVRSLRKGEAVWYAPDQNVGRSKAVFVDFFGHKAATTPASSRLSAMTGARVVPFQVARKDDGSGYLLTLEPALEDFPTDDLEADTQRISGIVERWVRENPEQYLWIHQRFRSRPQRGDPELY